MSAYSVLVAFENRYFPSDTEALMPEISEIDSRLPTLIKAAFDAEIYKRAISFSTNNYIDDLVLAIYQSYILYLD